MPYPKRISLRGHMVLSQNRALKQWVDACLAAIVLRWQPNPGGRLDLRNSAR